MKRSKRQPTFYEVKKVVDANPDKVDSFMKVGKKRLYNEQGPLQWPRRYICARFRPVRKIHALSLIYFPFHPVFICGEFDPVTAQRPRANTLFN